MRAGKLRHVITLLKQTTEKNKIGEPIKTWKEYTKIWCEFIPLSTNAIITAQAAGNNMTARCIVRCRNDINSGMRIQWRGQTFNIIGMPIMDANTGQDHMTLMLASVVETKL